MGMDGGFCQPEVRSIGIGGWAKSPTESRQFAGVARDFAPADGAVGIAPAQLICRTETEIAQYPPLQVPVFSPDH